MSVTLEDNLASISQEQADLDAKISEVLTNLQDNIENLILEFQED